MTREPLRCYPDTAQGVRLILALLLASLLVALTPSPGAAAEEAAEEAAPEVIYTKLSPDLIVNLRGSGAHFLMVSAQIQTRSQSDVDNALYHSAAIHHHLLMSMGEMGYREALTPEGRQQLAEEALAIVRQVLDDETGGNEVQAVLFTSYLVE